MRILITGARAPAALELGRLLSARGHGMVFADSFPLALSRFSNCSSHFVTLPSPRLHERQFIDDLITGIQKYDIQLLIPTCEEIFYLAKYKEKIEIYCPVFCDNYDKLMSFHHKHRFMEKIQALHSEGIELPASRLIASRKEALEAYHSREPLVFKPVYSRFGSRVIVLPQSEYALPQDISSRNPWVAQQYIEGQIISSYSIVHRGTVTAHRAYRGLYFAGKASVYFKGIENPRILQWIKKLAAAEQFHGQISFDFIETAQGDIYPIECNPRCTSGIHLFHQSKNLDRQFLPDPPEADLTPEENSYKIALALLFQPRSRRAFLSSKDVIYSKKDPLPVLGQCLSYLGLCFRALKNRQSVIEATVEDIRHGESTN